MRLNGRPTWGFGFLIGLILMVHANDAFGGRFGRRCRRPKPACCCHSASQASAGSSAATATVDAAAEPQWTPLFDGQTLEGWKVTNFGGQGEVEVKDQQMILHMGFPLTGITTTRQVPTTNYELRLEAMRQDGIDFFCGLTFPVNDSHCSFIVGGWAGSVVGISSIDGDDAARNETTAVMNLEDHRWYKIRVRVTPDNLSAWLDDLHMVDLDLEGRRIDIRIEVDPSKPLGISAFETKAALRNIELRTLEAK